MTPGSLPPRASMPPGADAYDDNALHQLVRRTREKIGDETGSPKVLITLPGVGYRLDLDPPAPA